MASFSTDSQDYKRYGLDDSRCSALRPVGSIQLTVESSKWIIVSVHKWVFTRKIKWTFARPLLVRRLHDRFLLHFTHKDFFLPSLMLLIPFSVLNDGETKALNELSEKRHRKNVNGDFYGISEECGCIGVCSPLETAPNLIGYQEEPEGCYFKKQPQTEAEYELAIQAVLSAITDNLRYSGNDPNILGRIRAATRNIKLDFCQSDLCDYPTQKID